MRDCQHVSTQGYVPAVPVMLSFDGSLPVLPPIETIFYVTLLMSSQVLTCFHRLSFLVKSHVDCIFFSCFNFKFMPEPVLVVTLTIVPIFYAVSQL